MKNTELTELAFHVEQLGKLIAAPSDEMAWHFQFGRHLAAIADFRDELMRENTVEGIEISHPDMPKSFVITQNETKFELPNLDKAETLEDIERSFVPPIEPCRCTPEVRLCEGRCDCEVETKDKSFVCMRNKGHIGPHVACGSFEHNLEIWE